MTEQSEFTPKNFTKNEIGLIEQSLLLDFGDKKPRIVREKTGVKFWIGYKDKDTFRDLKAAGVAGRYDPETDTCFVTANASPITVLHELGEAWIHRTNTEFDAMEHSTKDRLIKAGKANAINETEAAAQQLVLQNTLKEGAAEWIALQSAVNSSDAKTKNEAREEIDKMSKLGVSGAMKFVRTSGEKLADAALNNHRAMSPQDAVNVFNVGKYDAGYCLIDYYVMHGQQFGIDPKTTLERLISVPPKSINQMLEFMKETELWSQNQVLLSPDQYAEITQLASQYAYDRAMENDTEPSLDALNKYGTAHNLPHVVKISQSILVDLGLASFDKKKGFSIDKAAVREQFDFSNLFTKDRD